MAALDDEIREGLAAQAAGDWGGALDRYTRVVAADPGHAHALYLAGMAQAHAGQFELSEDLLRRCLAVQSGFSGAAPALGCVLLAQAKYEAAAVALDEAVKGDPTLVAVHFDLGTAYQALQQWERAAGSFERATALRPDWADAHFQLGNVRKMQGRLDEAAQAYAFAVRAWPEHASAWQGLGVVRQMQQRNNEAIDAYGRVLRLAPGNHDAANNLGLALRAAGRIGEAIEAFRCALGLAPGSLTIRNNLAVALQDHDQAEDAVRLLENAPDEFRTLTHLGNAYVALNQLAQALVAYGRALAIDPTLPDVRYNVALAQLVMGDFERGWVGYDARLETERHRELYAISSPRWHGDQSLAGRTILVYAEQGLGDTIQFVRFIPLLEARGARVIVRVQTPLQPLLAAQSPTARYIASADPLPAHDFHCPLLSLPRELGIRIESVPAPIPYVLAPPAKVALWRKVFAQSGGLKVGLVWAGNPKHQADRQRSIPLRRLFAIADGIPAHFFALQKEHRPGDAEVLSGAPWIVDLSERLRDFEDTAAIIAALDLVITVDTAIAHLAGALGTRTWLMLAYAPDWRWLLGRADTPWYPTMRLFRQPTAGDWTSVFGEVKTALAALVG